MFSDKKIFFIILCAVVVLSILLTAFVIYNCFYKADSSTIGLNENEILKIAQSELEKSNILNEKNDYLYDLKKDNNNWNVKVQAKSKDPNFVVAGGGCQMQIDGITGEVLYFYILP